MATWSGTKVRSSTTTLSFSKDSWSFCRARAGSCVSSVRTSLVAREWARHILCVRYSMTMVTTRWIKELSSPREARKKKVFLRSPLSVTRLEKNPARKVGRLWNLAGTFLKHWRIVQTWKRGLKGTNKKFALQKLLRLFTSIFDQKMPITARFSVSQEMWMLAYILSCAERHLR